MSVAGMAVGDPTPARAFQPVRTVDANGNPVQPSGAISNADGSTNMGGLNGTSKATLANPVPVRSSKGPATDRSGTIATGGTAQALAAANTSRNSLTGQNLSTGDLWVNETGTAAPNAAGSYLVASGGTFAVNGNGAVSIYGAVTGQRFASTETN